MTLRRFIGLAVSAAAAAVALQVAKHGPHAVIPSPAAAKAVSIPAAVRSLRPKYPYSVVPGGVYSPAELAKAIERDRLTREHYDDFRITLARLVVNPEKRFAYVSYRLNDKIFWTQKRLLIPKGEALLTDGQNFCRTRCGNRLSFVPRAQINEKEPSEKVLNLPDYSPKMLAEKSLDLAEAPSLGDLALSAPPLPFEEERLKAVWPSTSASGLPSTVGWPEPQLPAPHIVLVPLPLMIIQPATTTSATPATPTPTSTPTPPVTIPNGSPLPAAVPEPATVSLLFTALAAGLAVAFRRAKTE